MRVAKQDDVYEENEEYDTEVDTEAEGNEQTSTGITSFWGIPKNVFFIIVGIVIIGIIGIVIFCTQRDKLASSSSGTSGNTAYDVSGNVIGTYDELADGMPILDSSYSMVGTINSNGTIPFYDESGNQLSSYDSIDYSASEPVTDDYTEPVAEDYTEPVTDEYTDDYTDTDTDTDTEDTTVQQASGLDDPNYSYDGSDVYASLGTSEASVLLKSYGYTGDEIEMAQQLGLSTEQLVTAAQAVMDQRNAESLERMSDHASKEYQTMHEYSIFSMPKHKFVETEYTGENVYEEKSFTVNADFEKVPTYGNQLMLKVKVANNLYGFMVVDPERFQDLPKSGNMVVEVKGIKYGKTANNTIFYITDISEVDTSSGTVNPDDTGASIGDLIDNGYTPSDGDYVDNSSDANDDPWSGNY